jgi:isochorismate hydrolase
VPLPFVIIVLDDAFTAKTNKMADIHFMTSSSTYSTLRVYANNLLHLSKLYTTVGASSALVSVFSAGVSSLVVEAADALNDCSKSAMISSMCSVPTEMRMRSCEKVVSASDLYYNIMGSLPPSRQS